MFVMTFIAGCALLGAAMAAATLGDGRTALLLVLGAGLMFAGHGLVALLERRRWQSRGLRR